MIALIFSASLSAILVQNLPPTWLRCNWTQTRSAMTSGTIEPDKISQQSRVFQFDPTAETLSFYDPENLTLTPVSAVIATKEAVSSQEDHHFVGVNGVQIEDYSSFQIDRRTLKLSEFRSIGPVSNAPKNMVLVTGDGQCEKIAPEPLAPAQF